MQKLLTFFSKNISVYAIFNDKNFNDTLTNYIVSFEQPSPDLQSRHTTDCTMWPGYSCDAENR